MSAINQAVGGASRGFASQAYPPLCALNCVIVDTSTVNAIPFRCLTHKADLGRGPVLAEDRPLPAWPTVVNWTQLFRWQMEARRRLAPPALHRRSPSWPPLLLQPFLNPGTKASS